VLGTHLSLCDADQVYSAIGKSENFVKITNFPLADLETIKCNTKRLLNVEDSELPPDSKLRKLEGRFCFSFRIFQEIIQQQKQMEGLQDPPPKTKRLDMAIEASINLLKKDLRSVISQILENDSTGSHTCLLSQMLLAYKFAGGKISFARQKEVDFVDHGICSLKLTDNDFTWILCEELVIDVIEEELVESCVDPEFFVLLKSMNKICNTEGSNNVGKGAGIEQLIRQK
jgi:hypothetical protein